MKNVFSWPFRAIGFWLWYLKEFLTSNMSVLKDIDWANFRDAFPVLITMITMPLTYSITNGIGFGFILFTAMMLFTGRARQVHWLMYLSSLAFILYFLTGPLKTLLGIQ